MGKHTILLMQTKGPGSRTYFDFDNEQAAITGARRRPTGGGPGRGVSVKRPRPGSPYRNEAAAARSPAAGACAGGRALDARATASLDSRPLVPVARPPPLPPRAALVGMFEQVRRGAGR
jgi:hypothetical protein